MSELSDEAIMDKVKGGQGELLELLIARYERPLFAFAVRILEHREAAQDVFQESFVKVWRKRDSYRSGSPFRPWLYQICLNACRDQLRKKARSKEDELKPELPLADSAPGPDDLAEREALAQRVRQAVGELPEKHREILILHHFQHLGYAEISQVVGIPQGTIKSRMFHALQKLADRLRDLRPR